VVPVRLVNSLHADPADFDPKGKSDNESTPGLTAPPLI